MEKLIPGERECWGEIWLKSRLRFASENVACLSTSKETTVWSDVSGYHIRAQPCLKHIGRLAEI